MQFSHQISNGPLTNY